MSRLNSRGASRVLRNMPKKSKRTVKKATRKKKPPSKTYKFRAETIVDVITWLVLSTGKRAPHTYTITQPRPIVWPDVEVTYTSDIEGGLVEAMYRVSDGHVMIQTHALVDKYTGERDDDREWPELEPVVLSELIRERLETLTADNVREEARLEMISGAEVPMPGADFSRDIVGLVQKYRDKIEGEKLATVLEALAAVVRK